MGAATAMAAILQCTVASVAPADASVAPIGMLNIPLTEEMAMQMADASYLHERVPVAEMKFVGDPPLKQEWIVSGNRTPEATSFEIVRVTAVIDMMQPFEARVGTAIEQGDDLYAFTEKMKGRCVLREAPTQADSPQ